MSDSKTIVCPECQTQQQADVPFCDNCGYRLGRQDAGRAAAPIDANGVPTELEHPAVPKNDGRASAARVAGESGEDLAATEVEGYPAIRAGRGAAEHESTAVEGLAAVPAEPGNAAASTERGVPAGPMHTEARGRAVLLTALWVSSLVAAIMVTAYFARSSEPTDAADTPGVADTTPIEVESATFERGLGEKVRAFILRTCLKVADDADECDQEELLSGEYPVESVSLEPFAIDPIEVTVMAYGACVDAGKCEPIPWKDCKVYTHQGLQISLRAPRVLRRPNVAVTCVDLAAASAYCEFRQGRLPTHDEWEFTARGSDGRVFPWGSTWDPRAANWGEMDIAKMPVVGEIDGYEWAAPPGSFPDGVSPIGAHDMAGNVAEWVVGESSAAARGGSWASTPFDLRATGRLELADDARRTDVGFRCAYPPGR